MAKDATLHPVVVQVSSVRRVGLLLASVLLCALHPAVASEPAAPWADSGWLPEGWRARETTTLGPSDLGTLPSLIGRAPGEVLLAAETLEEDTALFLVEVEAPLTADNASREALLLSAPEALRHLWGVEAEVRWVDLVQVGGEPTLQLQGRFRRSGRKRHLRLALLPRGEHHLLLVLTWPEEGASELAVKAEQVLLAVPGAPQASAPFWTASTVVSTVVAFLAAFGAFLLLGRRRR
ncbi:MAG: hypothetical protein P1V51_06310 [Deltaproteobacteria bacterium]|nr:hypothetical protein [Deltaproteobacteria bacterium]